MTENERDKTSTNPMRSRILVDDFQEANTEDIVEEEIGGSRSLTEYLFKVLGSDGLDANP